MPQSALETLDSINTDQPQQPKRSYLEDLDTVSVPAQKPYRSALEDLADTPDTTEEGVTRNNDGSWVVTPKDGESFADTMKRAAAMGSTASPELLAAQTRKAVKTAPYVLAAAPLIGAAGVAAPTFAAQTPEAVKVISDMAKAHPVAAALVKKALLTVGGATAYKHSKWLMDLLP